jgi:hypothetical protein
MKKKLMVLVLWGFVLGLVPMMAFAQGTPAQVSPVDRTCLAVSTGTPVIETIICRIGGILNTIIPFLIVLAIIYFIWGVIQYVIASDEEAKKSGRNRIIYGIIGLAVIVGVWGLVNILTKTFGIDKQTDIVVPCLRGTPGC